jgi:hypothetical protein
MFTLAGGVTAQATASAQCGGTGYTGTTLCGAGFSCEYVNQWYSQCQDGSAPTTMATSTSASNPASTGDSNTFWYLGRHPATNELSWPGTGIAFTFTGTSATIGLSSVSGTNSVDMAIDGGAPTVISNVAGTSITTPSGLAQGDHTVVLHKHSEALYGSLFIGDVTSDGTLGVDTPPQPARSRLLATLLPLAMGLTERTHALIPPLLKITR